MIFIPLKPANALSILAQDNWCKFNIGPCGPTTWIMYNAALPDKDTVTAVLNAGMGRCIAIYSEEDATAFKLRFNV